MVRLDVHLRIIAPQLTSFSHVVAKAGDLSVGTEEEDDVELRSVQPFAVHKGDKPLSPSQSCSNWLRLMAVSFGAVQIIYDHLDILSSNTSNPHGVPKITAQVSLASPYCSIE
jgi:hypothetical protein